ncbi:hypothetical protein VTO73DRAFT_13077 [Trametes versicolor]
MIAAGRSTLCWRAVQRRLCARNPKAHWAYRQSLVPVGARGELRARISPRQDAETCGRPEDYCDKRRALIPENAATAMA